MEEGSARGLFAGGAGAAAVRLRAAAMLAALALGSGVASADDTEDLIQRGLLQYRSGKFAAAAATFDVAAFMSVNDAGRHLACLARLAVAQDSAGQAAARDLTLRQFIDDERLVGEFRASSLEPDLRDRFKTVALTHLARDRILSVDTLAAELGLIPARPTRRPTPSPTAFASSPPEAVRPTLTATPVPAIAPTAPTAAARPTSIPTWTPSTTPVPPTPTTTRSPSATPTDTATRTSTPSFTPSRTATRTHTAVPPSATPSRTSTPSFTPSRTATRTHTAVPPSATSSRTSTPSFTPSHTATRTHTAVPPSPTPSRTSTPSFTPSDTATRTPSPTPSHTATRTPTPSFTATRTHTRTASATPIPPTATATRTASPTPRTPTATTTQTRPSTALSRYPTLPPSGTPRAAARPSGTPGPDVLTPRPIERVMPVYPEQALKDRARGVVVLDVLVSETGQPIEVTVKAAARKDLTDAAVAAAKQWRFEPARKNGVPVRGHAEIRFPFEGVQFARTPFPGDFSNP